MAEEQKSEHPHAHEKKRPDFVGYFKSWRRIDWIALAALMIFVVIVATATYWPKAGCEVARAGYKCEPAKDVMIENCVFWGDWSCEHCEPKNWQTCGHESLPQIEWYIGNLCEIHNSYHPDKFDCSNLKLACNQATGEATCPLG